MTGVHSVDSTASRRGRGLMALLGAVVMAGTLPLPFAGDAAAAQPLATLQPPFLPSMPMPPSLSAHGAIPGHPIDPRYVAPADATSCARVTASPATPGARHLGISGTTRCVAPQHGRQPVADAQYRRPASAAAQADMDVAGANPAVLTSGPPTFSSPNWVQQQPATSPPARYGDAMAYDEVHHQVVLFGGVGSGSVDLGDTWTWNGSSWTQQAPAAAPSARAYAQMAFDQATGTVVLFGGSQSGTDMNDTWSWNGSTWTHLTPASSPVARDDGAMAYDAQISKLVLFGGETYSPATGNKDDNDTWTFDGTSWVQLSPSSLPSARHGVRAAYDSAHSQVVVFGGQQISTNSFLADTWTFNGTTWTQQAPTSSPPARSEAALAYDPSVSGVVLFGGYSATLGDQNDTWRWDGSVWAVASGIAAPSGRDSLAMAFDAATGQLLQFGGFDGTNVWGQTWTYNASVPTATVALTSGSSQVSTGSLVGYQITAGDPYSGTMSGVTVSDTLPGGLSTVSIPISIVDAGTGGTVACGGTVTCSTTAQGITVSGLTLPAGDSLRITYQAVAIGSDRACSLLTDAAQASSSTGGSGTAGAPVTVCDVGLGTHPWQSSVDRAAGPQSKLSVDAGNGDMVLNQADDTAIPLHRRLDLSLARSYNSEDTGQQALPASMGARWVYTVGEAGAIAGDGVTASGLLVPSLETPAASLPVTVVEASGARDVFMPSALPTPVDVTGVAAGSPLSTVEPVVLALDTVHYNRLCVDTRFTAPAGIHLSIWRITEVNGTSCSAATASAVLGFAAERPDRTRFEFAWDGHLLDIRDSNGNELKSTYAGAPLAGATLGALQSVTEPSSGRSVRFTYLTGETDVSDAAGRVTKYFFDTASPANLARVLNPDGSQLTYTYGGCTGAAAGQLCSTTDPRGTATSFSYANQSPEGATYLGPARVATVVDRGGTTTTYTYHSSPDQATADESGERQLFTGFDTAGRAAEADSGDTSNNWLRQVRYTWDATGATCRKPDAVVDNDVCHLVRSTFSASTPNDDVTMTYDAEGNILDSHQAVSSGVTADTTYGYHAQYLEAGGSFSTYDDTVAGGGSVTTPSGTGPGGSRTDSQTLLYVSDFTQTLPPRGNAAGTGYAAYLTSYKVDDNSSAGLSAAVSGGTCSAPAAPNGNTGNRCEVDAPVFDGSHATVTRYTYDAYGQQLSVTTPKSIAETPSGQTPPAFTYTYYQDTDRDLSGTTSAGGWVKALTDPLGHFVAYGYDAAGNPARSWDRNATQSLTVAQFPGTLSAPPSTAYTEVLYGSGATAYSAPWRFVLSQRDPMGNLTSDTVDNNGNQLTVRPPRGNQAGSTAYDITQTYNTRDEVLTKLLPAEATANKPYSYTYDAVGNKVSQTDPNGNVIVFQYDAVNRQTATVWTRGAWPSDTSTVPSSCRESNQFDTPIAAGRILCSSTTSYDGVDNVIAAQDGNHQTTSYSYDALHRQIEKLAPRNDGTFTTLRTDTVYDLDGDVTDVCPPRQFTEGGSSSCTSSGVYSTHTAYDVAGRASSVTTYRSSGGAGNVTGNTYDADGNVLTTTNPDGHTASNVYDLLDHPTSSTTPRDASTNETTTTLYDPDGNVLAVTAPGNRITAYSYDADGRKVDTVQGSSSTVAAQAGLPDSSGGGNIRTRTLYDADGHVVAQFEPRAFVSSTTTPDATFMTRTDYDADGRVTAVYVPRYDGGSYSDLGLSSTQTSQCPTGVAPQNVPGVPGYPAGVGVCTTRYQYDYDGNRAKETLPTSSGTDNRYVAYAYTDDNLLLSLDVPSPAVQSGGRATQDSYVYDADGKPVRTTDALGHQQTTSYTSDELVAQVTSQPNGAITHVTSSTYDGNGNAATETDGVGNKTTHAYYTDNLEQSVTDGAGDVTSYVYDNVGNPTQVTSPAANAHDASNSSGTPTSNTYTYDNLVSTSTTPVSPDGSQRRQIAYGYDDGGRKTSQHTTMVNGSGALLSDAGSQAFTYFADDRLQQETGRDGSTITTTYDAAGDRSKVVDSTSGGSTITATYYVDGLARSVDDGARTTKYTYDGQSSMAARSESVDGSGTSYATTYNYEDAEMPVSMTAPQAFSKTTNSSTTTYSYDAGGHPVQRVDPNSEKTTWSFNNDDTVASVTLASSSGATLSSWTYAWDSNYRQTDATLSGGGAGTGTPVTGDFRYGYDGANRVNSYTQFVNGSNTSFAVTWDHSGNRLQVGTTHWSYNADGSIATTWTGTQSPTSMSYLAFGGLSSDGCTNYSYDGFDRVTKEQQVSGTNCPTPSSTATTYNYDGLGRQRTKTDSTGTVAFHYDGTGSTSAIESNGSTDTVFELDAGGDRSALTVESNKPTVQYLNTDGSNNITAVTGADSSLACTARFDAFGVAQKPQSSTNVCNTGSTPNQYFYRASRHDATTGDYQFGARTYDPGKGTFTQPDGYQTGDPSSTVALATDPLTANSFAYAAGDPVNSWDPSGHNPCRSEELDDTGQGGCTPEENGALYASDRGASGPEARAAGKRAAAAYRRAVAFRRTYRQQHRVSNRMTRLNTDESADGRVSVVHVGGGYAVLNNSDGTCITGCSVNGFGDGRTYVWNASMKTFVCGEHDGPGSSCGESATFLYDPTTGKTTQYDDGVRTVLGALGSVGHFIWDHKVDIGLLALNVVPGVGEVADAAEAARVAEVADDAATELVPAFTQRTAGFLFQRAGSFGGRSIGDVVSGLRAGTIRPSQLPIEVIQRGGNLLGLNTRSMLALRRAGISPTEWNLINRTGQEFFEQKLTQRLIKNGLTDAGTDVVRITGAGTRFASFLG